ESGQEEADHVARPGIFHIRCEIVAKRYGLSNRQREVLGMLAKGRNADYITEKLIISSHTAKAHIYNIYQKTGVHSRQELMDLVEDTDVADAGSMVREILEDWR
ncbi:response regulator transcription factor, partial [Gordonibacter sp.]